MILCSDPRAQYLAHRPAIDAAVARVLASNSYVLGPEVAAFEREFAGYLGAPHAVGVGSGTGALILALRAFDIGDGEVITGALSATATLAAIVAAGARPVLVDLSADTLTLSPAAVERAIGPRTKAVVAVHLHGGPADIQSLAALTRRSGIALIEDCAQSAGAVAGDRRLGTFGDVGCFSFYPTKNLGAIGDGGAVVTGRADLAERIRRLRQYGWDSQRVTREPGVNSRLDEIQAAVLRVKLPHLDHDNARRCAIATTYSRELAGSGLRLPALATGHVFHQYVVRSAARDSLLAALERLGVRAGVHYATPLHREPGYGATLRTVGTLAVAERAAAEVLSLPMYPELTDAQVLSVVDAVRKAISSLPYAASVA